MATRVLPDARDDLREAIRYYRNIKPPVLGKQLATRMMAAFKEAVVRAASMSLGRPKHPDIPGARYVMFEGFPYMLFYTVLERDVVVTWAHTSAAEMRRQPEAPREPHKPPPSLELARPTRAYIMLPVQGIVMAQALSTAEVVALTGLEERRVRKDVEYGVVDTKSPPRFELPDVVYFHALAELGVELDVEGRRLLRERIAGALRAKPLPRRVPLSSVLELKLEEIVEAVTKTLARFDAWKAKLVQDDAILGGEPVFPKSRLAVRQVGGMLIKGASLDEVKEDYPFLEDEDLELAKLFTVAYPRVGRPREAAPR